MLQFFKNFLKNHFLIWKVRHCFSNTTRASLQNLFHEYSNAAKQNVVPPLKNVGLKVFSQLEEDGLLMFLFAVLGTKNKTFIEIGSNDCINSNCANLALNFGWSGIFIDADEKLLERGKKFYQKYSPFPQELPKFICAKVMRENINDTIKNGGLQGEIDLLSIDIDGNEYWIWDAIEVVQPRVVIVETMVEYGMRNVLVPYDKNYFFPGKHPLYHGASPLAMTKLADKKGYRLVGCNELGFNHIYVRKGIGENLIPEVSVESTLTHPNAYESFKDFEQVKHLPFVEA